MTSPANFKDQENPVPDHVGIRLQALKRIETARARTAIGYIHINIAVTQTSERGRSSNNAKRFERNS